MQPELQKKLGKNERLTIFVFSGTFNYKVQITALQSVYFLLLTDGFFKVPWQLIYKQSNKLITCIFPLIHFHKVRRVFRNENSVGEVYRKSQTFNWTLCVSLFIAPSTSKNDL